MPAFLRTLGHRLYTTWATFWFVLPFFVTYPLQLLLVRRPEWRPYLHGINRNWAKFSIFMWGVPLEIVHESPQPVPQPCIYVANHGSYIDILLLFYTIPGFLNMMGKDTLVKFPLWGPIFGKTYSPWDFHFGNGPWSAPPDLIHERKRRIVLVRHSRTF